MTLRIIAKLFLLLVIIGFFMPMACDQNAFQLIDNGMLKSEGVAAIYAAFILSIIGLIIGVLLLVKKGVPPVIDWVVTLAVAGIVIIMFYYTGYHQGHHDSFQSGAYMALIGAVAALAAQIMSGVKVTVAVHFTKKQALAACAGVLGCLLLAFLLRRGSFGVSFLGSVLTLSVVAVMAIIFGGAVGGLIGLVFPFLAFLLGVYPRFIPLIMATVIGYALLGFLAGIICPKYALGGKQNIFVKSALVLPIILVLVLLTGIIRGLLTGRFDTALLLSLQQGIVTGIITALSVFVWLKRRKG